MLAQWGRGWRWGGVWGGGMGSTQSLEGGSTVVARKPGPGACGVAPLMLPVTGEQDDGDVITGLWLWNPPAV